MYVLRGFVSAGYLAFAAVQVCMAESAFADVRYRYLHPSDEVGNLYAVLAVLVALLNLAPVATAARFASATHLLADNSVSWLAQHDAAFALGLLHATGGFLAGIGLAAIGLAAWRGSADAGSAPVGSLPLVLIGFGYAVQSVWWEMQPWQRKANG